MASPRLHQNHIELVKKAVRHAPPFLFLCNMGTSILPGVSYDDHSPRLATHSNPTLSSRCTDSCVILLGLPATISLYSFRCLATHDPRRKSAL
mmetsp:Transcript_48789/g.103732  ORF Transcript_48789/g.103732 Transcript_48789/m.103732 type:complete len:93 (-) Transcript_48789:446-724(-)